MNDQSDGASARSESDAAAGRRWLITIIITVVFGGFGATMAYLSYAKSSEPSSSSRSPSKSPGTAPASPPPAEPSAPASTGDDKGKGNKNK